MTLSDNGFHSNFESRITLMIYVYADDGGDEKRTRVSAIGVVAGLEEWWQEAAELWVERCKGIPFHAKDCESDFGDYQGRPHEDNKAMYRDLTTILAQSKLGGIGIAIDLVAFKKVFPNSLHIDKSNQVAYHRAFIDVMERVATLAENIGEIAKLTFDVSTENAYNAALEYETMRKGSPELSKWLHPEVAFVPARDSPRVQMADLLTYEAWKALDHSVGPIKRERKSWKLLMGTDRFETLAYSEQWFGDLKRHIESGDLERNVKFNQGDYRQWLEEKGLNHNMTNIFRFLDWIRQRDS